MKGLMKNLIRIFFLTQILLKTFQRNFMGSLSKLSQIQQNIVIFLDFMRATEKRGNFF